MDSSFSPALAALLGALIPTLATVMIQLYQPFINRKEELSRVQREDYHSYLDALQNVINVVNGDARQQKGAIDSFFRATNKAVLYADKSTAEKMVAYRDKVMKGNLEASDHAKFQNNILNSMRQSMGLKSIASFEIIGNHLPDK